MKETSPISRQWITFCSLWKHKLDLGLAMCDCMQFPKIRNGICILSALLSGTGQYLPQFFESFSWQWILLVLKMILTAQWKMCTNSQDSQAHCEVPQLLLYYIMLFILLVSGKEKHAWHWSLISHYLPHKLKEESKFVLVKQRIEFLITKLKKRVEKKKKSKKLNMNAPATILFSQVLPRVLLHAS